MTRLCDLHTHSNYSDGTLTPHELVDLACNSGLSAIALCDHNTVDGIPDLLRAASEKSIEVVSGAEFSVDYVGKELHLLGLFIGKDHLASVSELMQEANRRKEQSNIELIEALCGAGISLSYEEIKSATPKGRINRAHIARALTEKGYTKSVKEAFSDLLSPERGYYREPKRITVFEMLDFLVSIDATPVLAHPFLNLSLEELEIFLPKAKERGLKGMECLYSLYGDEETQASFALADKYILKYSGGSDFHGIVKPDIYLGRGKGNLKIPYEWLEALREK